jgi:hypothetical protein
MSALGEHSVGKRLAWWFIVSTLMILALTAMAKGIAASGNACILSNADPVLDMFTNRQVMLLAAVLELVVIGVVVWQRDLVRKAAFIAWIGRVFLAYRVGLWSIGNKGSCGCLGNVTVTLGITPATADLVSGAMLAYLLVGSYAILIWESVAHMRARRGGPLATAG